MIKIKLYTVILIHWVFIMAFFVIYTLSFWYDKFLMPFFGLVFFSGISWIPHKDCPLLTWENNLRKKIDPNFKSEKFFYLMRQIEKIFRIRLPSLTTPFMAAGFII